jgi:hypothetical protein
MENDLFEIKTKHEIRVAQMREYIEGWLRKYPMKIIKIDQQEAITIVLPPPSQQPSTKETPLRK